MSSYLALLRGVNVGGNGMVKMSELKVRLEKAGLENVRTYIQSGNVMFESGVTDTTQLARQIEREIKSGFDVDSGVVVIEKGRWQRIVRSAPTDWGQDPEWKHNLLILLEPYDMDEVVAAVGELKPDIEALQPGDGVLYQSVSFKLFGRTTTGKLASKPIYKRMTIRNYNTAHRLAQLLDETAN